MNRLITLPLLIILLVFPGFRASAQQDEPTAEPPVVAVHSPFPGQALQGNVSITGNTLVDGFQFAELTFAYSQNPTNTWFLIHESWEPISDGELTQWDTSMLTDGDYTLRLIVTLEDGNQIIITIPDLRIRNYTPIETDTPVPTATSAPGDTPVPTVTPTPTVTPIPPTVTPLPPNPAQLSAQDILLSFGKGVLLTLGLFSLLGLYQVVRYVTRRK